jgi:CHAT domain-containing protein
MCAIYFFNTVPQKSIILIFALALVLFAPAIAVSQPAANGQFKEQIEKAKALRDAGSADEARKIYESVLPPLRAQGPSQDLVDTLNNLSDIATMAGEYDHAVVFSRESITACQKMHDKNCEAQAHSDAGLALSNAGNYDEAAAELDLGLKLTEQTQNARTAVIIRNNLGIVYYYQAKYSEALRAYESAMQDVEKVNDRAATWRQITLLNLATLYQRVGNDKRAIGIYTDILAHPKDLSPRDVAHMDANMGALFRRLGDPQQALLNYTYADEYYAKEKDTDGELAVLKNTGIVLALELNRLQDALKTFDRALELAEKTKNQREVMQARLYRGETLYRMGKLPEAKKEFTAALAAADQLGTVEEQWKAVYAIGKIALGNDQHDVAEAMFRDAIKRIESVRSQLQLSGSLKSGFLADKRDVYDALIKLLLERNDAAAAFEFMERSRSRVFQDRFFGDKLSPDALTLRSIQGRLNPQTALIEFWAGVEGLAAVWVTRDSAGIAQSHLSSDEMDALGNFISGLPDNLGKNWRNDFQKISTMLPKGITPFADNRYSHVLIVPDGFLSLVPFELVSVGAGKPLLETRDVAYLPSAVLLLRGALKNASAIRLPWQQQLVGFGDPQVIGSGESSLTASRHGTGALPASGEEIRAIARMTAGRTRLFLGPEDQKHSFFDSARSGAALLHVSTHAVADMDDPERSRLLFSPEEPGQPNNYIFLKELYDDLDLRGMSLATLSACDTERGRFVPGEGIQAFSRALLAAGSRSALTTLWRVPDQPTSEFMQHFYYFLLKKHKSKSEALRLAKLEFLHSGTSLSHPRYWAAFVLNGDGTEPVPRFIPWQLLAMPIPIIALAVFFYWYMRRKKKAVAAAA